MGSVSRSVSLLAAIMGAPPRSRQGAGLVITSAEHRRGKRQRTLTFGSNGERGFSGPLGGELTPERGH